ncbi:MAG: hypothetical protein AAF787_11025 [Chloroflexota bacterium]
MQTYWIVIAGLKGAGKSTFMDNASERVEMRDRIDMSVITDAEQQAVLRWLETTGGALDPDRITISPEEEAFHRWMRRVRVGQIDLDHRTRVCFYEAPGNREFDFLWEVITPDNLLGSVIVIDSTKHPLIRDASRLAATIAAYAPEPYVFAANKQDCDNAMPAEDIRILLQFLDGHLSHVFDCVATEKADVQRVLIRLLEQIRETYDDGIEW